MKFNPLSLFATFAAVLVLGSCTRHAGEPVSRTKLYANATNVDLEGFIFFKTVYAKAVFEMQLARAVLSAPASGKAKELAGQVVETYEPIIPELEELSTASYVILPDPGMPEFAVPHHFTADSLGHFDSEGYIEHVQHEQGAVAGQLDRAARNTSKALRHYAHEHLPAVKKLFVSAGGTEDHQAHH